MNEYSKPPPDEYYLGKDTQIKIIELYHGEGLTHVKIAKKLKLGIHKVRKVLTFFQKEKAFYKKPDNSKAIKLPSRAKFEKFLTKRFFSQGSLGKNWNTFIDTVKANFPSLKKYSVSGLSTRIRKEFGIKSMNVSKKSPSYNAETMIKKSIDFMSVLV